MVMSSEDLIGDGVPLVCVLSLCVLFSFAEQGTPTVLVHLFFAFRSLVRAGGANPSRHFRRKYARLVESLPDSRRVSNQS